MDQPCNGACEKYLLTVRRKLLHVYVKSMLKCRRVEVSDLALPAIPDTQQRHQLVLNWEGLGGS